jgi:isopropylmalate/homocitrate/citramalate synthase
MAVGATGIEIVEVSPRDGLQNEAMLVPTAVKTELVRRASSAGLRRIEVTSFVNPKRVPQMADAEAVMSSVRNETGFATVGLVMNHKGFQRALAAGCSQVNFVIVASETFNRRNQGSSITETLAMWFEVSAAAASAGIPASLTIGASFGCPFEGEVPARQVISIVEQALAGAPYEIAFADTIGCGVPSQVHALMKAARRIEPAMRIRCHFHNTRNTALANVAAAVEEGANSIDASIGGIGGCPFAPSATGNVATEDVVYMLERMGIETGISLDGLLETAHWLGSHLGKALPSGVARAGGFPSAA